VHVLTRGGGHLPAHEQRHGVSVHRVTEPPFPKDMNAFLRWVDASDAHMRATGVELIEQQEFALVHSHDWLVAGAAVGLARQCRGSLRCTPPSSAATRGGYRTIPSHTSCGRTRDGPPC
jgi:glycogen(starch) synthase